jgi:hypothetical protein
VPRTRIRKEKPHFNAEGTARLTAATRTMQFIEQEVAERRGPFTLSL